MGEQAKTIEYRFGDARPHEARSFQGECKRSVEPQKTTMRLRRAMKNPIPATNEERTSKDVLFSLVAELTLNRMTFGGGHGRASQND